MFKFEQLRVYQEALLFVDLTYLSTNRWPKEELFGLTNQFRRAAVSVALNIAEGTSRTKKTLDTKNYDDFYEQCDKLARMLNALRTSIK